MNAQAHLRPAKRSRYRLSKVAGARDTIAGFTHSMDVVGLTYGQFSLIDLIQATLDLTGPADVAVSTWSAGFYDIEAASNFARDGRIRTIRFVMDSASQRRNQASNTDIAALFGSESIRTTRNHAKFALIGNQEWKITITSSMNLNLNPRLEQFEMTDDPDRYALFIRFVDGLFEELPAGVTGDRTLPALAELESVRPAYGIEIASKIRTD